MAQKVTDFGSNQKENILFAAGIIGRSKNRRKVFEAIYRGKMAIKSVDEIVKATKLTRQAVLDEGQKLYASNLVEKTKKDNQVAYKKD